MKLITLLIGILSSTLFAGWNCIVSSEISAGSGYAHTQIRAINKAYLICDANTTKYFECTVTNCMER